MHCDFNLTICRRNAVASSLNRIKMSHWISLSAICLFVRNSEKEKKPHKNGSCLHNDVISLVPDIIEIVLHVFFSPLIRNAYKKIISIQFNFIYRCVSTCAHMLDFLLDLCCVLSQNSYI